MPAYRDKRTGRWRYRKWIDLPDGKRERITGTPAIDSKKAAEAAEHAHVVRVLDPSRAPLALVLPPPAPPVVEQEVTTLEMFAETYMDKMRTIGNRKGKNKPSTVNAKESHLREHLLPRFGKLPLEQIDELAIEDLKLALGKRGRSPKTTNNVLSTLRNILVNARKRKLIAAVPEIEWIKVGEQEFDFFDFAEAERLIAGAARVDEWSAAVVLALKTGMRLGELRAVRWQDVDLAGAKVHVRRNLWRNHEGTPKNGRSRTLDLPASAVAALKAHRHLRGERVFANLDGADYSVGEWRYGLYKACRRAGLRDAGWHVLRHTFASHLAMRGVPLRAIQELMGHGTIQMTTRYAHLAPAATRAAVARLDEPAPDFAHSGQQVGNSGGAAA
jgi:integrase